MTRINTIPVQKLSDQHLLAEHKEILRTLNLSLKAYERDRDLIQKIPGEFILGPGHVKFFYNKLQFIIDRYGELRLEMKRRDFVSAVGYIEREIPSVLKGNWIPTPNSQELITNRIRDRILGGKKNPRYMGLEMSKENYLNEILFS